MPETLQFAEMFVDDGCEPFIIAPPVDVPNLLSYFIQNGIPCTKRRENSQNVIRFPGTEDVARIMSLFRDWERHQRQQRAAIQ